MSESKLGHYPCFDSEESLEQTAARADNAEALANARLIAAAPEMLDALKWAVEKLDECGKQVEFTLGMVRSLQGCRDAISKAEGGQQ